MSCSRSHISPHRSHRVVLGFFSTEEYFGTSETMVSNGKRRRMGRPLMKPMSASRLITWMRWIATMLVETKIPHFRGGYIGCLIRKKLFSRFFLRVLSGSESLHKNVSYPLGLFTYGGIYDHLVFITTCSIYIFHNYAKYYSCLICFALTYIHNLFMPMA